MSTEITIAIDRHLKNTHRLDSYSSPAVAAVLLKLVFEASLDLHIEEQLHRICRCFLSFLLGIAFQDTLTVNSVMVLFEHPGTTARLPSF